MLSIGRTAQFALDLLDGRQSALQFLGERRSELVLRDADGLRDILQRIFRHHPVSGLTQNEAAARLIVGMTKQIVHSR